MNDERSPFRPESSGHGRNSIDGIRDNIAEFDAAGRLTSLDLEELHRLGRLLDHANNNLDHYLREHDAKRPSMGWMLLSVISGFGGIPLTDMTPAGVALTAAGVLGAGKSLYDHSAHLAKEQRLLTLLWEIEGCAERLREEMIRRGIMP